MQACANLVITPGPQGLTGSTPANGTNGLDAVSYINGPTTLVPANQGSVTLPLLDPSGTRWMAMNECVFIGTPTNGYGYYKITGIVDTSHVTVQNLGDGTNYPGNINGDGILTFADGTRVSPGGFQGPAGTAIGSFLIANNLSEGTPTTMRASLGLGGLSVLNTVDNSDWNGAGAQLAVANGGTGSATAIGARGNLGIGTIGTQNANAVSISGGTISGVTISSSTIGITSGTISGVSITSSTGSFSTLNCSGAATFAGQMVFTPSTLQTLLAAGTINPNAPTVRVVGSGGAVTLTSTPTLQTATGDGQEVLIIGTDATNTVTVQDNGTLAGSKLKLGSASRVLGLGSILKLHWDQGLGLWLELSFRA